MEMEILREIKEKAEKLEKKNVKEEKLYEFFKEAKETRITKIIHDGERGIFVVEVEGNPAKLFEKWKELYE